MCDHALLYACKITRSDIRSHVKWAVCLVIVESHLNLPQEVMLVCMDKTLIYQSLGCLTEKL